MRRNILVLTVALTIGVVTRFGAGVGLSTRPWMLTRKDRGPTLSVSPSVSATSPLI